MKVIVVGCGRVGAELALSLQAEHQVTVIDTDRRSFDRLGLRYTGRTVQGEALDRSVLQRAGIETADALAVVTASDNVNVIVASVARKIYNIQRVVTRAYNPRRRPIYDKLNVQTVSSSSWGAHRIEQLLVQPDFQNVYTAGNGEVQVCELSIPPEWSGRKLSDLLPSGAALPVSLARAGRGLLPGPEMLLQAEDVLQVSATDDGLRILRQRVHTDGHGLAKE